MPRRAEITPRVLPADSVHSSTLVSQVINREDVFVQGSAAQVSAIRGQRAMIQFRGFSPPERDILVAALARARKRSSHVVASLSRVPALRA